MKKLSLTNLIKFILIPSFCLIYCICCNYVPAEAKDYIQKGIGDGNTTLMQIPWTNEIAQKYFMKNKDGSVNSCKSAWRFTSYALVTTSANRVANNSATKSWSDIAIATTYNIGPGKSLALRSNGSFNFPFDSSHYGNIFMIRIPWQNYETNINSILNYTYDINIGEDANPAAANAYNCETIGWAFTAGQTLDIIVRVESALINKNSTKYINLYFDTVSAGGTRKFGFASRDFTVFALGSGFDAEFIQYLTLLQILTQLTSGVPVNVSGLSLDGDITIDMSNIEAYLDSIVQNQIADHETNNDIDLLLADIYDLLAAQPSQGQSNTVESINDATESLTGAVSDIEQTHDNVMQDLNHDLNNVDITVYDTFNDLYTTSNYFKNVLDTYFTTSIGDFKALIIIPIIVTVFMVILGKVI